MLPGFVYCSQRLGQHCKPLLSLFYFTIRLGQQSKKPWPSYPCPRGPPGGQTLVHLRNPLLSLPLLGQCPASHDNPLWQPLRKHLLTRERNQRLCSLLSCLHLPTELTEPRSIVQGPSQAERVRQLLSQGERLVAPLQGLLRIAKHPQGPSHIGQASHPRILHGTGAVLLGVVEGHPLLQVLPGRGKLSKMEQGTPQRLVGPQEVSWVVHDLGQAQKLLPELTRRLMLRPY